MKELEYKVEQKQMEKNKKMDNKMDKKSGALFNGSVLDAVADIRNAMTQGYNDDASVLRMPQGNESGKYPS